MIDEKYKNMAVRYYIENVEIPTIVETIDYYEGLSSYEPKYESEVEYYKNELKKFEQYLKSI